MIRGVKEVFLPPQPKDLSDELKSYLREVERNLREIASRTYTDTETSFIGANGLRYDLSEVSIALGDLGVVLDALGVDLEDFKSLVDTNFGLVNNSLVSIGDDISQLNTSISSIDGRLVNVETILPNLTTRISSVETNLSNITTRVSNVETDLSSLTTKVNNVETDLSSLTDVVDTVKDDISILQTTVNSLTEKINLGGTDRPSNPSLYQAFFDSSLGRPIWWSGSDWVDSEGNIV